jgi:hypothetical protein
VTMVVVAFELAKKAHTLADALKASPKKND